MTNLASVLKSEISRLAKRETKEEIKRLKTAASSQRSEIAALKKRTLALEQMVRRLSKAHGKATTLRLPMQRRRDCASAQLALLHNASVSTYLHQTSGSWLVHPANQSISGSRVRFVLKPNNWRQ